MIDLLPLGSVVRIKDHDEQYMIYGRLQKCLSTGEVYDYLACPYPLGAIRTTTGCLFNDSDIIEVFFIGFQDIDEFNYRKALSEIVQN